MNILPPEMIVPQRRKIRDLRQGETGYAPFTALRANDRGECFLKSTEWLREPGISDIQISRNAKGFHVEVPSDVTILRLTSDLRIIYFFSLVRVASIEVIAPRHASISNSDQVKKGGWPPMPHPLPPPPQAPPRPE